MIDRSIRKIASYRGYEAWAAYDDTAEVWEVFASSDADDYMGCFDTLPEATRWAARELKDRAEGRWL